MDQQDPVEAGADGSRDLYDISQWEPRTALDRLAVRVYRVGIRAARATVVLVAAAILLVQFLLGGIGATFAQDPYAIGLVALSVVPALALVAYVYLADVTTGEPLELLVGAFVLGVLFAGFAAILNSVLSAVQVVPLVGPLLFFYLVVGPVEESVKLLAVRLYPYRDDRFDAVVDGAVYGAAAGLGFATIENALYITRQLEATGATNELITAVGVGGTAVAVLGQTGSGIIGAGGNITAVRALAGPGHVIYSAFAGYYLGLAKFNPEDAGPIVVKGLLIAAFIHGTYNVTVGITPAVVGVFFPAVPPLALFFGFVLIYDGLFGALLVRKLSRYRAAYNAVEADNPDAADIRPERTEFED
ncbi:PrsW family intramembrane metalloprotease [Halosegnis sp.]|uniref:PrsW family intramembrane metalloprotease n=1 Tax=Halosegnis sp. TaxID=2864959 RepID=UPI0035D3E82F